MNAKLYAYGTASYGIYGWGQNYGVFGRGNLYGVHGYVNGSGSGVYGSSEDGATMIGVEGYTNYSEGTGTLSIGGKFTAQASTSNYSVQLIDGTETVAGRFLKNITTDGKANWANIIPGNISGGSASYVPRYNASGILSATSSIYNGDSGNVGIGNSSPTAKLDVSGDARIAGQIIGSASANTILSDSLIQAGLIFLSNNC